MNELNICYTIDNNPDYIKMMGVSIFSLIKNKASTTKLNIYILYKDVPIHLQHIISSMANNNVTISFIEVKPEDEPQLGNTTNLYFSSNSVLYCLLIPTLFSAKARVIYLDCDTLIREDLTDLYNQDFEDNYICALKGNFPFKSLPEYINYKGKMYHHSVYYAKVLDLPLEYFEKNKRPYFNGGVILFNIAKINQDNLAKTLQNNIIPYKDSLLLPDQDVLIKTFGLKIKNFTHLYNFVISPKGYNKKDYSKAYIYHYLMYLKPINQKKWHKVHLLKEYLQYLQQSPFKLSNLTFKFYYYKAMLNKFRIYLYKGLFHKNKK
ncbi:Glycosyltransferase family A [Candidatus Hepatincola sp. Pdp]